MTVSIANLSSTWVNNSVTYTGLGLNVNAVFYDSDSKIIRYSINNVIKYVLSSNGNVGIGLSNPSYTLHVNGSIYADSINSSSLSINTISVSNNINVQSLTVGNIESNGYINTISIFANNIETNGYINTNSLFANNIETNGNINVVSLSVNNIIANGSAGDPGYILATNSTGVYWTSIAAASVDLSAQYTWSNIHTFSNTVNITAISSNGSLGVSGQILTSNGTSTYWSTVGGTGTVTSVSSGDGLSGGPITTTGTLSVLANTGIVVNATGLFVNAAYINTISSNNSTNLNGQPASYYTNASNITTGTLPWSQAPSGSVNTSGSFTFAGVQTFNGNVVLGSGLSANGGFGTAGQVLHSNGTSTYWAPDDNSGGTVTSVASGNGIVGGTITTSGTLYILANTGIIVNATGIFVNSAYINTISSNNSTNLNGQPASYYTNASNITTGTLAWARAPSGTVNTSGSFTFAGVQTFNGNVVLGSGLSANGSFGSSGQLLTSNGTATYWSTVTGAGTVSSVATGNGMTGGPITTTGTVSVLANTGIVANATGLFVNATYINTISSNNATNLNGQSASYYTNASNITTGTLPWSQAPLGTVNTSGAFTFSGIHTHNANVIMGSSGLSANGGFGTSGQVLTSNGTATYWASVTGTGTVTSVATGNGMTGGPITSSGTVSVLANNGIVANSTGIFVFANTGLVSNTTGVHVNSAYINTISSNNATYLNGQLAAYYTNASNITTGTLPWAQSPSGTVNTTGAFTFSGIHTHNANVVMGSSGISSNGSFGVAGQVLTSNGTATYWSSVGGTGTVTSVATGNGMTGGPITSSGTVSVLSNTGIVANATGVHVNASYIATIASNSATYANSSISNTFTVGNSTYFVANGNVGIGTNSPATKLDVSGSFSIAKANVQSQTLTDSPTISWDTSLGQIATVTLSGNRIFGAPTNIKIGTYVLNIIQDGVGGRTGDFSNTIFRFPGGVDPILTSTANARDIIFFYSDGTNLYGSFLPDVR